MSARGQVFLGSTEFPEGRPIEKCSHAHDLHHDAAGARAFSFAGVAGRDSHTLWAQTASTGLMACIIRGSVIGDDVLYQHRWRRGVDGAVARMQHLGVGMRLNSN